MIIGSFLFFLLVFVLIGALSVLKSKGTTADYLTAGQSVKPWLVALSAMVFLAVFMTCSGGGRWSLVRALVRGRSPVQ